MAIQDQQSVLENMQRSAKDGRLSVDDVFDALRRKRITEEECGILLRTLEMRTTPVWRRMLVP